MKISVNWLRNYVNIDKNQDFNAFADLLTIRTAEVEEVIDLAKSYDQMVIGQIKSIAPHPNADKLKITQTDVGDKTVRVICGATNIFEGQKVPVALPGAWVRWHGEGEPVKLEPTKIRGEESFGMICAASEIGMKDEVDGIMDLSYLDAKAGTPLADALEKDDIIIDIENKTLTHRPDLWGHYGMAREIAAITDEKLKDIEVFTDYDQKLPEKVKVEVKDTDLCPRYQTVTLENIEVGPSPKWLRTALENTGNRSINNIVDATNFVMLELGNPLHAFDTETLNGNLIVRRAKNGEKITTLDEEEKELDTDALIIANATKPLAIAGIKGGLDSGITEKTTSITLEAANFDPISIRKTSTRLGIRTESVQRFEKDLDPLLTEVAINRLVKIILDLCPSAKVASKKQDINNFDYKPRQIKLDLEKVSSKIGVEISPETAKTLLEKLEFKVDAKKTPILVDVPSHRATKDINHADDLVEEIARLYGYENLPAIVPELQIKPAVRENTERREKYIIRDILSLEHGFNECVNYSFYSKKTLEKFNLEESSHLKLRNYLSEEQTHLRTSLIPNIFQNIKDNLKNYPNLKLYEIGRTYKFINQFFPLEEKKVAGVILTNKKNSDQSFYQLKTVINNLLSRLNIASLQFGPAKSENPMAHPTKQAAWFDHKSQQEIVHLFKIHPQIAQDLELDKYDICCFEINYTLLHQLPRTKVKYHPIAKFPAIELDVSILVDKNTEIETYKKAIQKSASSIITDVKLFDFYEGSNIPADKKSLAFKVTLQSPNRTLTDQEMKEVQQKVFTNLAKLHAIIRGL